MSLVLSSLDIVKSFLRSHFDDHQNTASFGFIKNVHVLVSMSNDDMVALIMCYLELEGNIARMCKAIVPLIWAEKHPVLSREGKFYIRMIEFCVNT